MGREFRHHFRSKLICAAVITLVTFLSSRMVGAEEVQDGVAAVVGSDLITYSRVRGLTAGQEIAARQELRGQELIGRIKEVRLIAINELIDHALLVQELARLHYSVGPKTTDRDVDEIIARDFHSNRKAWLERLRKSASIKIY